MDTRPRHRAWALLLLRQAAKEAEACEAAVRFKCLCIACAKPRQSGCQKSRQRSAATAGVKDPRSYCGVASVVVTVVVAPEAEAEVTVVVTVLKFAAAPGAAVAAAAAAGSS